METDIIKWFAEALDACGLTQEQVAKELGLNRQPAISEILKGKRQLKANEMVIMSKLSGMALPDRSTKIPVLGYVGAGAEVYPIDDGDPLYDVTISSALPKDTVGAIVRGDSMYPIFEDGDLVAYSGIEMLPEDALGKTCMVELQDGRVLIKTVRRGVAPGLYTLTSTNAPDIEDVEIVWARKFVMRMPREFWRSL
ncbi:S24 family peptidase [Brucella pituitosa]|uniref:Helix-turn-helix transcriptional regulator n=1 Tax=Brucella pituitosa TaxID=571256 RepID=A0A643EXZ6_9HYPH|nr:S24 family peptidase [Brucella pituitosa]KAB0570618.1 helix-turn-helix transcriptional regulator [Brucella pituitosa]